MAQEEFPEVKEEVVEEIFLIDVSVPKKTNSNK